MPKRTKEQALERLMDVPDAPGLKGKLGAVNRAARLGAAGLIMLDPLNRLADEVTVVPYDMIAIPAHEYFRLNSDPTFQIYIRGGETIMPTGGNVRDVQEVVETVAVEDTPKPRKKTTAYQRKYKKAFAQVKPKHMKKDGTWKMDKLDRAV